MLEFPDMSITADKTWRAFCEESNANRWHVRSKVALDQTNMGVVLGPTEREAFCRLAHGDCLTPSRMLRSFAEAYAAGYPRPTHRAPLKEKGARYVYAIMPRDIYNRVKQRAEVENVSIATAMRSFVRAYLAERFEPETEAVA
jgi:hypothetical protein